METDKRECMKFESMARKVAKINFFSIYDITDARVRDQAIRYLRQTMEHLIEIAEEAEKMEVL